MINFQQLSLSNTVYMNLLSIMMFFIILRTTHILRYNKTIALFGAVLSKSVIVVLSLMIEFAVIFMAFALLSYSIYINNSFEYRSISSTAIALSEAFLGKFHFDSIVAENGVFGGIVMLVYLIVMMCLMMNIFVASLNYILVIIQNLPDVVPNDHKVIIYLMDLLKPLFGFKSNAKRERESKENTGKYGFVIY